MTSHGDAFASPPALAPRARRLTNPALFFYDAGAGPPLVLIHGGGDEADSWRRVLPPLSSRRRVVAPDLPGFGRSNPLEQYGLENIAAAVSGLAHALGLERFALVGSSLGAAVASLVAAERPERVSHLVMVGGPLPGLAGPPGPAALAMLEPGAGEAMYNGLRSAGQEAAYATLAPYYADLAALPEPERAFLRERVWARVWSDTQRDAFLGVLRALYRPGPSPAEIAGRLRGVPTLLLWGERDAVVGLEASRATLELLPGARLEIIPGAGHLPHQERPGAFVEALERFLGGGA